MKKTAQLIRYYCFFALLLFTLQAGGMMILRTIFQNEVLAEVDGIIQRVKHGLRFEDGKWDTSLYNSDPFTAYPNSSSSYPLYIITTDGFVIERSKPITGLLDTADYKHLMQFQQTQEITTVTNEHWRVLSKPVVRNGKNYGVIMVAQYLTQEASIESIDKQLFDNVEKIDSFIVIENDKMNVDQVDIRHIQYLVSFEVVDTFNKVLINDGRLPTFIDASYVDQEFQKNYPQIVEDKETGIKYLINAETISDDLNNKLGIVVAARSVQPLISTLNEFLKVVFLLSGLLPLPLSLLALHVFNTTHKAKLHAIQTKASQQKMPEQISFDKKASILTIDDEKIDIVYSSNQYYLCKAVFSAPKKRFEQDELVEMMGFESSPDKFRKVYDAMLAINKKTGMKLISYQDKTYSMNSDFVPLLTV